MTFSNFCDLLQDFNWFSVSIRVLLSVIMGGCIGIERGFHGRAAGLRTHILVCIGSCLTALTGCYVNQQLNLTGDVFRISAQVISGIGFLGAGTIMVRKYNVTGLTTAAGLWVTASIGVALGYGFYLGATLCTLSSLMAVVVFTKFETSQKSFACIYIEIDNPYYCNSVMQKIRQQYNEQAVSFNVVPSKSQIADSVGLTVTFSKRGNDDISEVVGSILKIEHIILAVNQ